MIWKIIILILFGSLCTIHSFAEEIKISLSRDQKGVYMLQGFLDVNVPVSIAWEVLTDYDNIDTFVSSLETSSVKTREKDVLLIEQKGKAKAFLFQQKIRLLLRVSETALRHIAFDDVSYQDFKSYSGSWCIESTASGVRLRYVLLANPHLPAMQFIVQRGLKNMAKNLLYEVKVEMEKRCLLKCENI
ncbi:MAG: hypothetical protein A3I05_03280 [Deltaproteobacteria bacterium RIFCSPLOWO2_02_FULL_44_10]|nr:MAG: hypothetical protein A3C46_02855 [Deltaproteobacteria bacterium RIFCSPHIGHO2_02_FULL_44_16]OGQ46196.1 MAG: hypothetical protein A3I05_03280 [Deltaproteobacteria bacterium RIFCSPLOWO2_02_FULL_44_10]